ncbi:MAG: phosphatase [Epulopiscium sp. Nuni2H_MBin003]|nr:MAG: phosphatase [Epulopiscium sp. Nuni2H_MBin003]
MKFLVDIHTHTVGNDHAYSTFDENARFAKERGIEILGISEHAPELPSSPHWYFFMNMKIIPKEVYGMRILKGIELNIIDYDGNIDDIDTQLLDRMDFRIASLHPPCIKFADIDTVTKGIIAAMHNPYVNIIGHPGDNRFPQHLEELVKASKATNTLLELNNASLTSTSLRTGVKENMMEILRCCNKYDVPIIANTDAHICYEVGEFKEAISLIEEVQFPKDLILNLHPDRLLDFLGVEK